MNNEMNNKKIESNSPRNISDSPSILKKKLSYANDKREPTRVTISLGEGTVLSNIEKIEEAAFDKTGIFSRKESMRGLPDLTNDSKPILTNGII